MKKRFISICLLCCILFSLAACGSPEQSEQTKQSEQTGLSTQTEQTEQAKNYPQVSLGTGDIIYGDTIFYHDIHGDGSVKYQKISNIAETGNPLIDDMLLEESVNPFKYLRSLVLMAVDYEATEKNGGMPVLIITYSIGFNRYTIVSFNTKTNKITEIKDDISDNVQSLHVYGDIIYYTVNRGDKGNDICRVDTNGKNHAVKDNPNSLGNSIKTIYKDKIYYFAGSQLRSCNLDFSEDTSLTAAAVRFDSFGYGNYVYYCSGLEYPAVGDFTTVSLNISRISTSDPSVTEVFIEDIAYGRGCGNKFYYFESNPRLFGNVEFDDGTNVLNVMDLDTMETSVVFDYGDNTAITYYAAISDSWIYLYSIDYAPTLADPSAQPTKEYFVINTETFERIDVPR